MPFREKSFLDSYTEVLFPTRFWTMCVGLDKECFPPSQRFSEFGLLKCDCIVGHQTQLVVHWWNYYRVWACLRAAGHWIHDWERCVLVWISSFLSLSFCLLTSWFEQLSSKIPFHSGASQPGASHWNHKSK